MLLRITGTRPGINHAGLFVLDLQYVMQPNDHQTHRMHGAQRTLLYGGTPNLTPKGVNYRDTDTPYVHSEVVEDSEDCR